MRPTAHDERLSVLREQIVDAGKAVQRLRKRILWTTIGLLTLPVVIFSLGGFMTGSAWQLEDALLGFILSMRFFVAPAMAQAIVIGLVLAIPIAAVYRNSQGGTLRRRLALDSSADLAAILLPLQNEKLGDTRKVVAALLRELGVTDTELVPAEPTAGTGTEATSSEPPIG